MTADTLTADTARIGAWIRSGNYDYKEQIMQPQRDLLDDYLTKLTRWWNTLTYDMSEWDAMTVFEVLLGVAVLVIVVYVLWQRRYRFQRFKRAKMEKLDFSVADDNIYGVDFDSCIREAFSQELFGEVVRLCYLKNLRSLADRGIIDWALGRTPDSYLTRVPPGDDRKLLLSLTQTYVRVRYGHYPVSREMAEDVCRLVEKGGEA